MRSTDVSSLAIENRYVPAETVRKEEEERMKLDLTKLTQMAQDLEAKVKEQSQRRAKADEEQARAVQKQAMAAAKERARAASEEEGSI